MITSMELDGIRTLHQIATRRRRQGFTIVELLIVIVVIAILAAITIVAYNGIQNRAKATSAQTAAAQAAKKVLSYMAINSDQAPPDLTSADVRDSNATTYQYSVNTASNPQTFCITATANGISYFINNTDSTSPSAGGCPGHGANGIAAVSNYVKQPIASSSSPYTTEYGSSSISMSWSTTDGPQGGSYQRMTIAPSNTSTTYVQGAYWSQTGNLSANTSYTWSIWVRSSVALTIGPRIWYNPGNVSASSCTSSVTLPVNTWTKLSCVFTTPSTVTNFYGQARASLITLASGATFDAAMPMMSETSGNSNYADGNSSGWVWNGSTNNSTSTGPAKP